MIQQYQTGSTGIGWGAKKHSARGAGYQRGQTFDMRPTLDTNRGYGEIANLGVKGTQTPETPPIITQYKLKGMQEIGTGVGVGNHLQETKLLSTTGKRGVDWLTEHGHDKAAHFLHKLVNHLQVKGYGHTLAHKYDEKIHGAGWWSSIKGWVKDHVKEYKIGSKILHGASVLAGTRYPAVGMALDALSNYVESKGYGSEGCGNVGRQKMIHI